MSLGGRGPCENEFPGGGGPVGSDTVERGRRTEVTTVLQTSWPVILARAGFHDMRGGDEPGPDGEVLSGPQIKGLGPFIMSCNPRTAV